jgi:23S rRNA pseudouridine1911/1915/1917 synthase
MPENDNVRLVDIIADGARLDQALAAALGDLSRSRLKALIEAGAVSLDGKAVAEPSRKVRAGQRYVLTLPETAPAEPPPQAMPLTILYEDAAIIVVDKPAGLVVHPAPGNPDRTLVNALLAHCGSAFGDASLTGIGGVERPGIVHRLDKDTSGVMVAAKTAAAHASLTAQFAARSIGRSYLALAHGAPRPAQGRIEGPIGRSPRNRKKMAVVSRGGKHAVTHYATEARYGPAEAPLASLLRCRLETGRTHQIRVHLAHIGHPIVGDPLYGRRMRAGTAPDRAAADMLNGFPRQALHAQTLALDHPESAERLEFSTKLPQDFIQLVHLLEQIKITCETARKSPYSDRRNNRCGSP